MIVENCRDNLILSFLYVTTPVEVIRLEIRAVGDKLGPVKIVGVFVMTSLATFLYNQDRTQIKTYAYYTFGCVLQQNRYRNRAIRVTVPFPKSVSVRYVILIDQVLPEIVLVGSPWGGSKHTPRTLLDPWGGASVS